MVKSAIKKKSVSLALTSSMKVDDKKKAIEHALNEADSDDNNDIDEMDDDDDDNDDNDDEEMVDANEIADIIAKHSMKMDESTSASSSMNTDSDKPNFAPLSAKDANGGKTETRKVLVPPHRYTPLKENWLKIYTPLVQHMKLQIRMNVKSKSVELRTSPQTEDAGALQRGTDFVRAFMLGFDIADAIALLRLDNLYVDTFEINDVKPLHGDHLSRAIGRIAGKSGKTKFTIENVTKTRIVLADSKIHILGSFQNIKIARDAVVSLILGSPPGKVYGQLRSVANRLSERF